MVYFINLRHGFARGTNDNRRVGEYAAHGGGSYPREL